MKLEGRIGGYAEILTAECKLTNTQGRLRTRNFQFRECGGCKISQAICGCWVTELMSDKLFVSPHRKILVWRDLLEV